MAGSSLSSSSLPPSAAPSPAAGHAVNEALTPLSTQQRALGWSDQAALWFSLGVGLLVMQVGAYLVPAVGTRDAVLAIVFGSFVGAGLLAWTARIGCASGLSSAGLMHATYGSLFARLPVGLNIVQLIGWTTFELVIMREGTAAIAQQTFGIRLDGAGGVLLTTLLWGGVLTALMAGSMLTLVRRFVSRFGLPLVIVSLLWLTWQFAHALAAKGFDAFWQRPGDGSMGMWSALDLVIAMPVSWLPLVADYARHGRSARGSFGGTWLGYVLANIWCYALGVMVVSVAEPNASLVTALLLAQGGLLALGLILIDELDNAYGDVYSGAVSSHSIWPRWSVRRWGLVLAVLCTLLGLALPMHSLEPFLLMLSSVFVPLFGVILGRLGTPGAAIPDVAQPGRRIDWAAAGLWLGGIALYHGLAQWLPQWGSALPTLAATFVLAWLTQSRGSRGVHGARGAHGR
ncbi:MAG: allantoin permease [Rhodoferax sp.]|nr:allantoin permease [Rhodoferax sp.]